MSIGVQSYPELYTMLIGWNLYDELWLLLTKTGLAFIPFIGIVLRNIAQPYQSQEAKDAAGTSLRRMEIDFITTLLIIFLGVSPFIPLDATKVSYTPLCQSDGENNAFHPGDTGTTWDNAFSVPSGDIRVPLWWYAVMAISEGFASSANTMVGCIPNLRKMVTEVDMTKITDPELKQELQRFELECYMPARTQYLKDAQNNASAITTIDNDRTHYGVDDTEWFGSHGFQDTYYQNLHATQPVKGFNYDPSADINADTDKDNPPLYGTPACSSWWSDNETGLKTRLNAALPQNFWDEFKNYVSDDKSQDGVIKKIVNNASATGYQYADNPVSNSHGASILAAVGISFEELTTYPKLYAAAESAPIIQALLLLMIYTFLPFALVFSGYRASSFIAGAVIIFSIIFWSFIWHLVSYADASLMQAFYGKDNFFKNVSPNQALTDMIIGTLLIIAPLFWFVFMGSMGIAVSNVVSGAFNKMNDVGGNSAGSGGAALGNAAKTAATAAVL